VICEGIHVLHKSSLGKGAEKIKSAGIDSGTQKTATFQFGTQKSEGKLNPG